MGGQSVINLLQLQQQEILVSEKKMDALQQQPNTVTNSQQFNQAFKKIIYPFIDSTNEDHTEFTNKSDKEPVQFKCLFSKSKRECTFYKNNKKIYYTYLFKTSVLHINKKEVPYSKYRTFCNRIHLVLKHIANKKSMYRIGGG